MKKINYVFICLLAVWWSLITDIQAQSPIKAGAARENITPPLGTIINGDFLPMYAREIHDSLYAKALAFDNVNTMDFMIDKNYPKDNYEKLKMIAHEISDSIVKSLRHAKWSENPVFKVANGETNVVRRQPSEKLLAWAKDRVRKTEFTKLGTADKASDDIRSLYALDLVKLDYYEPLSYNVPTQAIRIGEGTIGTLPGEFFSETGLKLKKTAPCKYYFSISLANGQFGYVPPASQFLLGGYETWLCSGSLLEVNAEEKISNTLAGLIQSLNK